jgi:hypothetical protein
MIDFTSEDFRFVSRDEEDPYWVVGTVVNCEGDYSEWKPTEIIEDFGWGFFNGLTMVSYAGYNGELPREDGDTSSFSEFDIYYGDVLVNEMSYSELELLVKSNNRENKLNTIL